MQAKASEQNNYPIKIAVFGSTGSIGTSTLEVVRANPDKFEIVALIAGENIELLAKQVSEFAPRFVGINKVELLPQLKHLCANKDINFFGGQSEIAAFAESSEYSLMLAAIVGFAGLQAVLSAVSAGKTVALANKESLVAGGALVKKLSAQRQTRIVPVDSEHSAIFQLLEGQQIDRVSKISLTASGGPFFKTEKDLFPLITPEQALRHPKWKMGKKNSLDSASMFNKALELIEAHWLFDIAAEKIDVVVHPQSIVHSFIHFADGSSLAQLSVPDMKGPIAYAMHYPFGRLPDVMQDLDLTRMNSLEFYPLDNTKFPAISLARSCFSMGEAAGAVFNCANEVAGEAFLQGKLTFDRIPQVVSVMLERFGSLDYACFEDLVEIDEQVRRKTSELFLGS